MLSTVQSPTEAPSTTPTSTPVKARAKDKPLPDCLVIGPQKTGTTWIHDYLAWRGDVGLPRHVKEVWFFDRYYARGIDWYSNHFAPRTEGKLITEVTPGYFHCEEAALRIRKSLGTVPVIASLRHPVEKTFSLYLHMRRYGMTKLGLREAAKEHPGLVGSARYAFHLQRWGDVLGEDKVKVLFFEWLKQEPEKYVRELCGHLGLEYRPIPDELRKPVNEASQPSSHSLARFGWKVATFLRSMGLHSTVEQAKSAGLKQVFFGRPGRSEKPRLEPTDRQWLLEELLPEVEALEKMLGTDLTAWKS